MADSTSPEPQDAAAPSALTSSSDPTADYHVATAPDHAPDYAAVVRRAPAPGRRPLPDAVAIHLIVVPDAAPPYDDALREPGVVPRNRGAGGRPPGQARREASGGRPAAAACADAADVGQAIAAMANVSRASVSRPDQGQFAGHWPSQFAQVLAETLAGSRPPQQLAPWTTQQARRRISQLGPLLSTAHRPRVKRVIVSSPTGGVLEMAVIVGLGTRVRALAVRLERTPTTPADDSPGADAADLQAADPRGPQAAAGRGRSGRPSPADHPGWICTAVEAA